MTKVEIALDHYRNALFIGKEDVIAEARGRLEKALADRESGPECFAVPDRSWPQRCTRCGRTVYKVKTGEQRRRSVRVEANGVIHRCEWVQKNEVVA